MTTKLSSKIVLTIIVLVLGLSSLACDIKVFASTLSCAINQTETCNYAFEASDEASGKINNK